MQSLSAALRRLQRQNRELAAQLAAVDSGYAGNALVPAGGPPEGAQALAVQGLAAADVAALQHEVSGLAAENAALRRQLAEAEEEAGRAQFAMHQQQAEARALHSQVVEVGGCPSSASNLLVASNFGGGLRCPPAKGVPLLAWQTIG